MVKDVHTPLEALREYFGYDDFRPGQRELIDAILGQRDVLGVMPTGAGKSICYQVPALVLPGITVVISPLVSLMNDQVNALRETGVPAAYLNSQLSPAAQGDVIDAALAGMFKLLYVAPERLGDARFMSLAHQTHISFIAVDEAHCVSQWGQDFRPSYLGIAAFIDGLSSTASRPTVAAFTATATPRVADDIVRLLNLQEPFRLTTGFDRPNLHFAVEQLSDRRKTTRIEQLVRENEGESGIIYCSTRKQVDSLTATLAQRGIPATSYHAGLSTGTRTANQHAFVADDALVMVATNAFGMGIDKSNVRYVAHFNMPGSLEAYYQEAGRAGRDGEPAECLLLWNDSDIVTARFFIESDIENDALSREEAEIVRASQRRRLAAMTGYCMTCDCLRNTILRYFGDTASAGFHNGGVSDAAGALLTRCGNCSNCDGSIDSVDVTKTARSVMRCVHEVRGRFGKGIVADILTGSKSAKVREWNLDRLRTYDIVDDSTGTIKEIIELLTAGDYLEISEGRYPLVGLGPRAREAATDEFRLYMKRVSHAKPSATSAGKAGSGTAGASSHAKTNMGADSQSALTTPEQQALFERLRRLRKELADAEGVPPYVVFSDAALRSMCNLMPRDEEEFLQVSGVGPVKQKRYARPFLAEINAT